MVDFLKRWFGKSASSGGGGGSKLPPRPPASAGEKTALREAVRWLDAATLAHARAFGLGEERSFNADQDAGKVVLNFADGEVLELDMHLLGSFRPHDRSFRWAWANSSVQTPHKAIAARDHASTKSFEAFKTPTFKVTFDEAQGLVAHAARLGGCDGVYRCITEEHLSVFVGYSTPKVPTGWFKAPRATETQEAAAIALLANWDRESFPHDKAWHDGSSADKETPDLMEGLIGKKTEIYERYWRRDDDYWLPSSFGWPSEHDPAQHARRIAHPARAGGIYVITQLPTAMHAHVVNFFPDGPRIVDQDIGWGTGLLLARDK
jgi:hypothetical protein